MIEKLLLFMREVHNKKIHSYPKDVLIAAVIFAAAVCQWGGNHGKAAETVSFAALEDIAEKKVAITFDDGPNPDYTEELLTGLKERGVNATFFLLGKEVEKYPEIVKDISDGGHLIGNLSICAVPALLTRLEQLQGRQGRTLSYCICRTAQRRGYAAEAVRAVIAELFNTEQIDFVQCGCFAFNIPSQQLLSKLGFTELAHLHIPMPEGEVETIESILWNN